MQGAIEVTPGFQKFNYWYMFMHDFFRIMYVTIYYYMVPFSTVIISVAHVLRAGAN